MKPNLRQPKYILPLLALPFFVLFFYVYQSSGRNKQKQVNVQPGINANVGDVADDIKKKELSDKLNAYRKTFKEADGRTAVSPVPVESSPPSGRRTVDSIRAALRPQPARSDNQVMLAALDRFQQKKTREPTPVEIKEKDPLEVFKQQMTYMDSLQKSADPAVKAEQKKKAALAAAEARNAAEKPLPVQKKSVETMDFNTIRPPKNEPFISAVIDENLTGFAGSRIRIRLLEDIVVGKSTVKAGTFLYALINDFTEQRVTMQVKSILCENQILPVKLDLYDMDGLPGLYVPQSAFREFTRDLGTNTVQGVSIDGSASFLMSTVDKVFQSSSSAIAGIIRKNKAKLKYNTYIYLIDSK
jgi:conjugative transposon TraM protein